MCCGGRYGTNRVPRAPSSTVIFAPYFTLHCNRNWLSRFVSSSYSAIISLPLAAPISNRRRQASNSGVADSPVIGADNRVPSVLMR